MSREIEDEVLKMRFDNGAFEKGVGQTMGTLAKLKAALDFRQSQKSVSDLNATANKFDMSGTAGQVDRVSGRFLALATVAVTALSQITKSALTMGTSLAKSITGIEAIKSGFQEYETNLGSIQTILANTAKDGTKLKDVTKALDQLNEYSDKTIYNFSDMTRNIGLFTNAGLKLKESTSIIKGFSNEAAASGTSAEGAAGAAYQLSQALSAGTIRLMDFRSLQNVGMGNKNMQQGLVELAEAMGALEGKGITGKQIMEDFNGSLEKKWLSADVMSKYLQIMAGDLDVAKMKSLGLTDAQIKMFQAQQKRAEDAATKVKTFTQLLGTLREAAGSGWARSFMLVFGNFNEAKKTFTAANDVLGGMIARSAEARNAVLSDWKKLGGRTVLLEAIKNTFDALMGVIRPIREAFREIFPPKTGRDLYNITVALRDFTEKLKMGGETSKAFKSTFKGIFAIFSIGSTLLREIIGYFIGFFGLFSGSGGSGAILSVSGGIGEMLVKLQEFLVAGGKIEGFFNALSEGREKVLGPVIEKLSQMVGFVVDLVKGGLSELPGIFGSMSGIVDIFKSIGEAIKEAFGQVGNAVGSLGLGSFFDIGDETKAAADGIKQVSASLDDNLAPAGERVKSVWGKLVDAFQAVKNFLAPVGPAILGVFKVIKDKISDFVGDMGIQEGLAVVNTGFFIALYAMFRTFLKKLGGVVDDLGQVFQSASGVLDQVAGNLKAMQRDVQANVILKIAVAVGLLAASLYVLSRLDGKKLAFSLGAVTFMMVTLMKAIGGLDSATADGPKQAATAALLATRVTLLSTAMIAISVAMVAMSGAVAILGKMKTEDLVKGVAAVSVILGATVIAATALEKSGGGAQIIAASIGIGILAGAMVLLAGAIKLWSTIDTKTLVDGGLKIAATIVGLGLAMRFMPPNMLGTAAGMVLVAGALVIMSHALERMGGLSVAEIVKSMIALGGALFIISRALRAMTGTAKGAAAVLLFAAALNVLVPAFVILGNLKLETILKGLGALAGIFVVLGVAGYVLAPVAPIIKLLAGAIALLGIAMGAIGGGMLAFAVGLGILAATGTAGVAVLTAAIISISQLIPLIAQQIGLGIIAFAKVIGSAGPVMVKAFTTLLLAMLDSVIRVTPRLAKALIVLIKNGLRVIRATAPDFISTAISVLMAFIGAIAKNAYKLAQTGADIAVRFIKGVASRIQPIINAGFDLIVKFIRGLSNAIDKNAGKLGRAGADLGWSIAKGLATGLKDAAGYVAQKAANLASDALGAIHKKIKNPPFPSREGMKLGASLGFGFASGIGAQSKVASRSAEGVASSALDTFKIAMQNLDSSGMEMQPRIVPVLDLTQMANEASKISGLLTPPTITPTVSYQEAAGIAENRAQKGTDDGEGGGGSTTIFEFNQTNNSPEAISTVDVYRNTNNLMSQAKIALGIE